MVFSLLCTIIQITLWWVYFFINKDNKINRILKYLIDILPCILLVRYHSIFAIVFLIGCLIADRVIWKNLPIGMLMFAIVYTFASIITTISCHINILKLIGSIIFMVVIIIPILYNWQTNRLSKIVCGIYGLTVLSLCTYAYLITNNIGFLGLVIGDSLLIVNEMLKQDNLNRASNIIFSISNSFYYLGLCFVPIALL